MNRGPAFNQLGQSPIYELYEPFIYRISPADPDYRDFQPPPYAPVLKPTEEEFTDPLKYINSLWELGKRYGICRIIPPRDWKPPFTMDYDKFQFSTRKQKIHELEARTRIKLNFVNEIKQYWHLQGITMEFPPVIRGQEVDLHSLYYFVEDAGGFKKANDEKQWYLITKTLGFDPACAVDIKRTYKKYLYSYELFRQSFNPKEVKGDKKMALKGTPRHCNLSSQQNLDSKKIRLSENVESTQSTSQHIQANTQHDIYLGPSTSTGIGPSSQLVKPSSCGLVNLGPSTSTGIGPDSLVIKDEPDNSMYQGISSSTRNISGLNFIKVEPDDNMHDVIGGIGLQPTGIGGGSQFIKEEPNDNEYQEISCMTEIDPGSKFIQTKTPHKGLNSLTSKEKCYIIYYGNDNIKSKVQTWLSEKKGTSELKQTYSKDIKKGQINAHGLREGTEKNTLKQEVCLPKKRGRKKKIVEALPQTSADEPISIKSEPSFIQFDPCDIIKSEDTYIKNEIIEPTVLSEKNERNGFPKIKENIKKEYITGCELGESIEKNILPKEISLPKKRGRKKKVVENLAPTTPVDEPISIKSERAFIQFEPCDGIARENTCDDDATVDSLSKYFCLKCNGGDEEEFMLLCDGCDDSYHTFCLRPVLDFIPDGDWRCPKCIAGILFIPKEPYGFEHTVEETSLSNFMHKASDFKLEMFGTKDVPSIAFEREYWNLVSRMDVNNLEVEYGTDLRSSPFGSGFPTDSTKHLVEDPDVDEYINSPWNLKNLPTLPASLLRYTTTDISGMTEPWMYVGMCFSTFCWHNEDHWSYSINYLHVGETKTWYGVPGIFAEKFEKAFEDTAPELFEGNSGLLQQLTTILNPNVFIRRGVPVYKVDQAAGEFVITFPRAYHAGFNQGFNFAEAVNFTLPEWIPLGRECLEYYSFYKRQTVFSHDELIITMATLPVKDMKYTNLRLMKNLYDDMLFIYLTEYKYRKRLGYWGCTSVQRYYFENFSDDSRQCDYCLTTCYVSSVSCFCDHNKIACYRHYRLVCGCSPSNHYLRYRWTVRELLRIVKRLRHIVDASREFTRTYVNRYLELHPLVSSKIPERPATIANEQES